MEDRVERALRQKRDEPTWIYCDIDGTLTTDGDVPWSSPKNDVIEQVKNVIKRGAKVVLWSATGRKYATEFAREYEIDAEMCLAKPDYYIDDNPQVRSPVFMKYRSPEQFAENGLA
jgi:hypothetical protein